VRDSDGTCKDRPPHRPGLAGHLPDCNPRVPVQAGVIIEPPKSPPMPADRTQIHPPAVLLFLLGWTLVGLAFAGQMYLTQAKVGRPVSWTFALGRSLADWYTFALISWPAITLARRFPIGSAPVHLLVELHLLASMVFSLAWTLIRAGLTVWIDGTPFMETLRYALVATLVFNMLVYCAIVTTTHAVGFYRQSRERERRELELERRLVEARLQTLQMQLNPHFLFNALNGVSALMYRDIDAADTMLMRLSELLREALQRTKQPWVSLRDDLAFLDRYLGIELIRFAGRLTVRHEIEPDTLELQVPNLILQPLVENAIKHGIEPKAQASSITLRASRTTEGTLRLEVEDNGRGYDPGKPVLSGIGLTNIRARLEHLFGSRGSLRLDPGSTGGVRAIVEFPIVERS